jgi:predicted methyltransferase
MTIRSMLAAAVLAAGAAGAALAATPDYVTKAVADPTRTAEEKSLDPLRKPADVLAFSGVKPGQKVAEYLPGGGYYTQLLSDVVGPKGKVYALETTTWKQGNIDATKKGIEGLKNVTMDLSPLGEFNAPPEKVDVFWTTLNYHDLHVAEYANVDLAKFNKHVFETLKPGGIYFIVDHAAAAGTGVSAAPTLHRIEKATLVKEVEAAGFKLVGESNVLAHPDDDHTKVVFDKAIRGKTDQFVLKFKRP